MSDKSFEQAVESFIEAPSEDTYFDLLQVVQQFDGYDPYVNLTGAVVPVVQAGRYREAVDVLLASMPGVFMSPLAHSLLAYSYEQLGEKDLAQMESYLAQALLATLLTSGDGSETNPVRVASIEDEYEVLAAWKLSMTEQRLESREGKSYDVFTCADREIWFELVWVDNKSQDKDEVETGYEEG